ncbi:Major Facilitator Superfamily [Fusarium albosuccineum]|uniref:Major Facilitator Superfamily n=1 Tax=Fusarium albosuccineum TaxID=1237068 RepID=A0A8H4L1L7_9HYPO|nr:Major Facilitator Superfamily [Fusarium albosuccineum]
MAFNMDSRHDEISEVPGTVALVDLMKAKESTDDSGDIILHPQPSNDPEDPLNWSRMRRNISILVTVVWCTVAQASQTWPGPAFAIWIKELGIPLEDLNNGTAIIIFLSGFGIMFMQTWALKYGRRAPYLLGSVFMLAATGFGTAMHSSGYWYAFCILAGFGTSPSFCVTEQSLLDVSFLHQRGTILSIYSFAVGVGAFTSPIVAGAIIENQGWHWCFYMLFLFLGLAALLVAVAGPETLFVREVYGAQANGPAPTISNEDFNAKEKGASVKDSSGFPATAESQHRALVASGPPMSSWKRYLRSLTLFRRDTSNTVPFFKLMLQPFMLLQLPSVAWMSIMLSVQSFLVTLVINTQSAFFSGPPHSFSTQQVGFLNFALLIGIAFGIIWGGPLTDVLMLRLARRRGGVSEAEDRLWMYIIVPFTIGGGILLWGVLSSYGIHWVGPCFGLILLGFSLSSLLPIAQGYVLDSYPELLGKIVQVSNILRNVIGGALTFTITPWIKHNGARTASILMAMLCLVLNLSVFIFLWKGKAIRRHSKGTYRRLLQTSGAY